MPHIHIEPGQHDTTASAFIVRIDQPESRLLLHRHKKLGVFLQIGGHVELHETPWQAVLHEVAEESGYEAGQLKVLQPPLRLTHLTSVDLHPYPVSLLTHNFPGEDHHHTDIAWSFTTTEAPRHAVSDGESDSLQLFSAAELRAIEAGQIPENVQEIGLFVLETCLSRWDSVELPNS